MSIDQILTASGQITSLLLQLLKTRKSKDELAIIQKIQASQEQIYSHLLDLSHQQLATDAKLQKLASEHESQNRKLQAQLEAIEANQDTDARWS